MKGITYTLLFLPSVFLPFLMISSYLISQETPGKDYVLIHTSGETAIQYQTVSEDKEFRKWRQQKADWILFGMRNWSREIIWTPGAMSMSTGGLEIRMVSRLRGNDGL